ncbi:MAG: hypothetical protein NZ561_02205 [Phycisphaerae bacterium]|nr:hypothetical protein [Phycisphaerae bacterium]MDW8261698.1 hypothetical protein [Phycisphaerales bacterium]
MGVFEARGTIAKAWKDLAARWQDIRVHWDDLRAVDMEKQLLQPLELDTRAAASAMDQLAVVLSQVRRECGED